MNEMSKGVVWWVLTRIMNVWVCFSPIMKWFSLLKDARYFMFDRHPTR
jgi:hypothetical protein